jgi:hypothetical protein
MRRYGDRGFLTNYLALMRRLSVGVCLIPFVEFPSRNYNANCDFHCCTQLYTRTLLSANPELNPFVHAKRAQSYSNFPVDTQTENG